MLYPTIKGGVVAAITLLAFILAGCSREDVDKIAEDTRKLILSADSVVITVVRTRVREDRKGVRERHTFRIADEAFRNELADAIEFPHVTYREGSYSTNEFVALEFYKSGVPTLRLELVGSPSKLSGGRQTVLVETYSNHKMIEVESTANLYDTVDLRVSNMKKERKQQDP